ncbi:HdeA/HdeB family chaperone [Rhizobiaceae sp. 2RAB30]
MKTFAAALAAAGTLMFALVPAKAEPVDMSTVTCGQMMGMKENEITFMLTWVIGYLAGTQEELSMDPDVLGKTAEDTVKYCSENQEMSVVNATKEVTAQ